MTEETRTAICHECKKEYEEKDKDCFHFIDVGIAMMCYECTKNYDKEFVKRMNDNYKAKQ